MYDSIAGTTRHTTRVLRYNNRALLNFVSKMDVQPQLRLNDIMFFVTR